ncbi:MAG: hypothetical protein JW925_14040 [Syntrophaceae bacterium]|nr:hypothetical protein [Syntrophaceae bacterium]
MKLSEVKLEDLKQFQDRLVEKVQALDCLEKAAQTYTHILYETFRESIVLARFFATIPYSELPEENQAFVTNLAQSAGIHNLIQPKTLVLSLLGTSGDRNEWNDRRLSKGHVGIPLASVDFIDAIPMMSRLLKQLGLGLDWINSNDTALVLKTVGNLSGVFYVHNARTEEDNQGRLIIAAQDFVQAENVETVFGIGGGYLGSSMFFTTIIFVREPIDRQNIERFLLQSNKFKTATMQLVSRNQIFDTSYSCV